MQDKISDKLPIFVCLGTQCKGALAVLGILALVACATVPTEDPDQAAPERSPAATTESAAADPESSDMDSELLFHVLAAERLGAVGDHDEALAHLLEAAQLSDDPELSRQIIGLAFRSRNWQAMVEGAQRWRELEPEANAPRQYGALAFLNLGQPEPAANLVAAWIESEGGTGDTWREAMSLLAAAEDEEVALAAMAQLIEAMGESPDAPEMLSHRGFLLWQLDRGEEALAVAVEAAEQSGEPEEYVWAAQLAAAEQDMELALRLYREARALGYDERDAVLAEAEILRQLERSGEAIELLAELPDDSESLYSLGTFLFQDGRLDEAAEVWERMAAMEVSDNPLRHAFLVAFLAELLEMDEQALAWYQRVDFGPNLSRAMLRRAILKSRHDDLDGARSLLAGIRQGPDRRLHEDAWLIEADLLREAGQPEEAVRLLSGALRDQPNNVAMLYTRAICAVAMDDIELAEQDFRRILQIEDDNAMALNALGYTLTDRTDRHQEAYRLIRRAIELEPDSAPIQDSMGWVYFRLGEPERALPWLEKALEGEDNPEIAAHLGEVLWVLGREDEALEVLHGARERFPDDEYLADTLERLGLAE